ncbi:hypothetical protein B0I35DRAFT_460398 [Stachybotrys elegans]|uniref:Uncharacterized protein n=1 Tax=Stachybotrys elegans TaxID=80388 RepID=A0A8K0WS17_9HYPO|nr:hypothetical protein B0I35DRAFT_460398 [Stachybotrys elegans]
MPSQGCQNLSFDEESAEDFGVASRCTRRHTFPYAVPELDRVWWLLLGRDKVPRSCREWAGDSLPGMSQTSWNHVNRKEFHTAIGCARDEPRISGLVAKIPGFSRPWFVGSRYGFNSFVSEIQSLSQNNHRYWCMSPPPVVIICFEEQFRRFDALNWVDSVAMEYRAHHAGLDVFPSHWQRDQSRLPGSTDHKGLEDRVRSLQGQMQQLSDRCSQLQWVAEAASAEQTMVNTAVQHILQGLEDAGVYSDTFGTAEVGFVRQLRPTSGNNGTPGGKRQRQV